MEPVLKYYSHNKQPNDEELKTCLSIAAKSKSVVMLYFDDRTTSVKHVFIFPKEEMEDVKRKLYNIEIEEHYD